MMVRKIFAALALCAAVFAFPPLPMAGAGPLHISVCGEGADEDEAMAVFDAYRRAVKKAVINFITTDSTAAEKNAIFLEIIKDPKKYVVGKAKVVKRYKRNGTAYAVCQIPVDMEALEKFVVTRLKAESDKIAELGGENKIFFFIRVRGNIDKAARDSGTVRSLAQFKNEFAALGYTPAQADELFPVIRELADAPQAEYLLRMEEELRYLVGVSFAVVGEIEVFPGAVDALGATSRADVKLHAYDLRVCTEDGKTPAKLVDDYSDGWELRRAALGGMDGANSYVIDKAAYNSAHYVATKIYEYWKSRLAK